MPAVQKVHCTVYSSLLTSFSTIECFNFLFSLTETSYRLPVVVFAVGNGAVAVI